MGLQLENGVHTPNLVHRGQFCESFACVRKADPEKSRAEFSFGGNPDDDPQVEYKVQGRFLIPNNTAFDGGNMMIMQWHNSTPDDNYKVELSCMDGVVLIRQDDAVMGEWALRQGSWVSLKLLYSWSYGFRGSVDRNDFDFAVPQRTDMYGKYGLYLTRDKDAINDEELKVYWSGVTRTEL